MPSSASSAARPTTAHATCPPRRMRSAFDNGCTGWTGVLAAVGAIDAAR